jgi:serine/arginine repetitive matrix protein 2
MVLLPFFVMAYTLSSGGPPTGFMIPTFFAATIGFFSNMAIAECNRLIMETYDTPDLQPGMTGRKLRRQSERNTQETYRLLVLPEGEREIRNQSVNRLPAGCDRHSVRGAIERRIGTQSATGVVARFLLVLTLMLILVLWRWRSIQVIPDSGPGPQFGGNVGS